MSSEPTPPPDRAGYGYGYNSGSGPGSWQQIPTPEPSLPPSPPPVGPGRAVWESIKATSDEAPVTVALVGLTIAAWLVHVAVLHFAAINTDLTLGDPESAIHGQYWRLFTPMLVHFGLLHLGMNMFVLWRLGPPVERVLGSKLFLASYILSGVGGQIASDVFTQPINGVWPLAGGASGAIFGVIGVLVGYYAATQWAEKAGRQQLSGWRFNPKAVRSLAIQGAIWLLIAGPLFHADSAAHAGGGVVGLVIGGLVGWSRTARPSADSHHRSDHS